LAGNRTINTVTGINIDKTAVPPVGGPPNDNIANATAASDMPFSDPIADTTNATAEAHESSIGSCSSPAEDKTIWYRFTAAQTGLVRVSVSGNLPSPPSTPLITIYRQLPFGLSLFTCGVGTPATSVFKAQQGSTYFVKIGNRGNGTGPFTVGIESVPPPPNDA